MITPSYKQKVYKEQEGFTDGNWYSVENYFRDQGYSVSLYDTTSSAGDWTLIISKDNRNFRIVTQENAYPHRGFNYWMGEERIRANSMDEAVEILNYV